MPEFYPESLSIEPEEFVDSCSATEVEELVNYLKEIGALRGLGRAPEDAIWNDEVQKLLDSKWKLDRRDEEAVLQICNKLI